MISRTLRICFVVTCLLVVGCTGSIHIERSESALTNKFETLKIVCIDPRIYYEVEEENYLLERNEDDLNMLKTDIVKFSKQNGIELSLFAIKDTADPTMYNELLKLKQSMLSANYNQQTALNFNSKSVQDNKVQKKVFVYPPKIPFEFSDYVGRYHTSLFSYIGIYVKKKELLLYHVVVDTNTSETIYREYKVIKSGLNQELLPQLIFDSFLMLKEELVKKT